MYKDVIQSLDSGLLPIIGLIAFCVAFTLIIVWAFTMKKEDRNAAKHIPLND
ncbi:MAG: cbb3-type cytochrome c oxidase subunit 3 [Rhodothermaceae bacterium]|nr:cbb3-type cytochrome c oxidase subunit 3 [Rhodothermaceae bacterium]